MNQQNKPMSLAADALTQFEAGASKVRIGTLAIDLETAFRCARLPQFNKYDDNEKAIHAIARMIVLYNAVYTIDSLSVEVVA